ncbi:oligosaccharide flippase family protein [Alcaligenaceae bacterium CGII-47]|nr:oligosaccharide flippase family protein [Alcaligenaceae bacterium CGII-47]
MIKRLVKSSIVKNTFWLTLLQVGSYAAQILLIPVLTRRLSIEEFGATMAALAVNQLAFVVTDYGFSLSGTYEVSKSKGNRSAIQGIINRIHSAKFILVVLAISLTIIVSYIPTYYPYQSIFVISIISIIGRAFQPVWFFQGIEDMRFYATYMSLVKFIYVFVAISIVQGPGDGYLVLLSLGVADVFGASIGLWGIYKLSYEVHRLSIADSVAGLAKSFEYFLSRLAVAVYTSASAIIVGLSGLTQVAVYASAEQVYRAGQSVTVPINQALYPFMARTKEFDLLIKIIPYIIIVLFIGSLVIGYFAYPIVELVFGPKYVNAVPVLRVFLLTVIINYIGISFGYPMFAALGRPNLVNKTVLIGCATHFVFIVFLFITNSISAINIVICMAFTESIVACLRVSIAFRLINKCPPE